MNGSLALHRGTLFVGAQEKTASVRLFDLDGRALTGGFAFRDRTVGRSMAAGIAVDDDRRVWVADTPGSRVRAFSLFGREIAALGDAAPHAGPRADLAGLVHAPVDVAVQGHGEEGWIAIACAGERRHAVQLFDPERTWRRSLASMGDAGRPFESVRRVEFRGPFLLVVEAGKARVQVFRDGEFLFLFTLGVRGRGRLEPAAVAALDDGRMLVACGGHEGALILVDGSGRWLRTLAVGGEAEGALADPSDVVVELGREDPETRVAVIDRDGTRVQVFSLEGRCFGSFAVDPAAVIEGQREADEQSG